MSTRIYTDGACQSNPGGPGGWAMVVTVDGDLFYTAAEGNPVTTNNIMEMQAVIAAMSFVHNSIHPATAGAVEILSDSQYVVNGITKWREGWKKAGWKRGKGDRWEWVKNMGLWQVIDGLVSPQMTFTWLRGHDGDKYNELADELAVSAVARYS
jgi:ribonuclease HI